MGGQPKQPSDLFSYLRGAFREKRITPQLLHAFYARRQADGEDLRDYSHALSQLLNSALQQSPKAVPDTQLALRDQFIEGVQDSALRRELRRLVREKPDSSLFDVRDEAMIWTLEDRPRNTNVARNRNLVGDSTNGVSGETDLTSCNQTDLAVTLQEVVKIIAQQGKAITELTETVRSLATQNASSDGGSKGGRPKVQPKFTSDGQPICLRCEGVGHMAKQCTAPRLLTHLSCGAGKQEPSISVSRAMRGKSEGSDNTLTKEPFLENAVGQCPEVDVQIGGVPLRCILDTGSNVSTLTESFFRNHLHKGDNDMHCTAKWLKLTAANKMPLPYLGYVQLDVEAMGITIPKCGFLIIKDDENEEPDPSLPGSIGMNIA